MCECDTKSGLSSADCRSGRRTVSGVTIAQLKCQQVRLPAQSNYSGHRFQRVIGTETIREPAKYMEGNAPGRTSVGNYYLTHVTLYTDCHSGTNADD